VFLDARSTFTIRSDVGIKEACMKVENVEPKQVLLMLVLMAAILIAFSELVIKIMG
jgi:hypothetical protein